MNEAIQGGAGVACCVIGVMAAIPLLWLIATYNRFARLGQLVKESWSGVDVELKRRHSLVPNLVETVKGYAQHEREALEMVIMARAKAMDAGDILRARVDGEADLGRSLGRLIAVAERYPQLKADRGFLELQRELAHRGSHRRKSALLQRECPRSQRVAHRVPIEPRRRCIRLW